MRWKLSWVAIAIILLLVGGGTPALALQAPVLTRPAAELFGTHAGYGYAGSGVQTATGNYSRSWTDLSMPVGMLSWTRTYNSGDVADGPLGIGWSVSLTAHVVEAPDGSVVFRGDDGRVLTFTPDGNGGYRRPQDLDADLSRAADGLFSLRFFAGNETWSFDAEGRLAIRTREGQRVTLRRDEQSRVVAATHSAGYALELTYDPAGRLTAVTAGDGRAVRYAYDDGRLAAVTAADGAASRYAYADGRLSRIEDAEERLVVANAYDGEGRVSRQELATGGFEFGYDPDAGATTVTSTTNGSRTTYRHDAAGRLVGVTDAAGNAAAQTFDDRGRLVSSTTRGGTRTTFAYDDHSNVVRHESGGAVTVLAYDGLDRLTTVTDPAGGVTRLAYTGDSLIPTEVTDGTGAVTRATAVDGLVTESVDPTGARIRYAYDAGRRLTAVTDPLGGVTRYEYDDAGRRVATVTPLGRATRDARDALGRVTASTRPSGARTAFRYSPAGQLLSTTDPTGAVHSSQYDAAGRRVSSTDPLDRKTTYTFDGDGNVLTATDAAGGTDRYAYDELGRRTSITHRTGAVTRYAYDADGRVTELREAAGTTVSGYDARGNVTSTTDPLGRTTRYEFDAMDRLVATTDPTGATTRNRYDAAGRLIATTDPTGHTTRYEYDAAGRRTAVIDPLGHRTQYRYDAAGRLAQTVDPLGGVMRYEYDADGRRVAETTPAGLVTRFRYDADGRVTHITDPRGGVTRLEYSERGEETARIAPDGAVHRLRYDAAGQLVATVDANGGVTRYTYDQAGDLSSLTDAKGARRTFASVDGGRERSFTDALDRTTRRTYDDAGNVTSVVEPSGATTRMEYNGARELTRRIGTDGGGVSYTYDGAGRRATMTDATGTTRYSYDAAGRLLTATEPDGSQLRMAYDAAGRQTSLRYPDGLTVAYRYDANDGLTGLDSAAGNSRFTLDPDGRLVTEKLPDKWERRYRYSGDLLVRYEELRAGRHTRDTVLTRGSDGLITAQVDGDDVLEYRYDAADQLIAVRDGSTDVLRATYDEVGNRTSIERKGVETRLSYDAADQLLTADTGDHHVDYRYDQSGRLVEQAGEGQRRTIAYDGFGLPAVSTYTKGRTTETRRATYNGDNLLVRLATSVGDAQARESVSTATRYQWTVTDEVPEILRQRQEGGHDDAAAPATEASGCGADADFVYAYDRILARNRCGTAVFAQDVFGSTVSTDETEAWAQARAYDPFGQPVGGGHDPFAGHGRTEQPTFGYRGELALGSSLYLRARVYDSTVGRFTARDPISTQLGQTGVVSPYAYANNSPQDFVDPTGEIGIGIGGIIGSLVPALLAALQQVNKGWDCPDPGNSVESHVKCFQGIPFKTRGEYDGKEWALNGAIGPLSDLWFGHKQEYAARAYVVDYFSNEKNSFWEEAWDWDWHDHGVNEHVDWEVRLRENGFQRGPEGPNGAFIWAIPMKIDLVVDERYIYEVKRWENGKWVQEVRDQLARYQEAGAQWGVTWELGTELTDWADGFEAFRYTGFLGLGGKETADVIIWGDAPGHVYFDEEKNVGDDERAKIKAKKKGGKGKMGGKGGKGGRPPRVR
jgi:RHS repeat-associated protein